MAKDSSQKNWHSEIKKISQLPQRKDSTEDQLRDLIYISNQFRFYDASDYIRKQLTNLNIKIK